MSGLVALYYIPRLNLESLPTAGSADKPGSTRLITVQVAVVFLSVYLTNDTTGYLNLKLGLPLVNQIAAWTIFGIVIYFIFNLAFCLAMPVIDNSYTGQHFLRRLVVIYLSFSPIFILLSVSYETLFFFSFAMTMVCWLFLEKELYIALSRDGYYQVKRPDGAVRSSPRLARQATGDGFRLLKSADLRVATFFLLFINISFFGRVDWG
jgi:phosphatidylinositol glycan class N